MNLLFIFLFLGKLITVNIKQSCKKIHTNAQSYTQQTRDARAMP